MTKISAILPVYNVEQYIKDCLDSIINQTMDDIEIICVNDGSLDNSLQVLEEYAQKDARIKIISQENQGQGIARNNGLKIANGEYITFIDPDDWVDVDMFEKMYKSAKKFDSDYVFCNSMIEEDLTGKSTPKSMKTKIKKITGYTLSEDKCFNINDIQKGQLRIFACVNGFVFKKEFILSNDLKFPKGNLAEDTVFINDAFMCAQKISWCDNAFHHYRQRIGSCTNTKSARNMCIFDNIESIKNNIIQRNKYETLKEEFDNFKFDAVLSTYNGIPDENMEEYFNKAQATLSKEMYKKLLKKIKNSNNFIENIFSVKNYRENAKKYKIITVLGIKFRI